MSTHLDRGNDTRERILNVFRNRSNYQMLTPSIRELCDAVGINSSTMFQHLQFLVRSGRLVRRGGRNPLTGHHIIRARSYALGADELQQIAEVDFESWWASSRPVPDRAVGKHTAKQAWMASRGLSV